MKLIHAQVRRYRSITEPTDFEVQPDVTCLVGKNESGKTAILQALYKSCPVDNAKFDPDLDYPSHKTREIHRSGQSKVTRLIYELCDDDTAAIEEVLTVDALENRQVAVSTGFGYKEEEWELSIDETTVLETLKERLDLPSKDRDKAWKSKTVDDLVTVLKEMETTTSSSNEVLALVDQWPKHSPRLAAINVLDKRRPRFVYFGDYDTMPGKVSIPNLIDKRDSKSLERSEEALLALLSISGVRLEDFTKTESQEHLIRQMENASNSISDEVFEYWSQNKNLLVKLKEIQRAEPGAIPPFNDPPLLQIRVENQRHRVSVPFDERSRGFVWFFSFLAYFSKLEQESSQPLILLLDEPGLSLHATAQHDLLRFINERLSPHHQVIFTTHSPFMIDANHFERIRTVVDDPSSGTVVSADVLKTDEESAFPLHAALGIELTQTLFVGSYVLLVEGPSDVIYLQYLSDQLIRAGKTGLDERWVLVPGGGLSKLPAFLALFGANNLKVGVLSDSSAGNAKIINDLRATGRYYKVGIVQVGDSLGRAEADVEDLFSDQFYIDLVNVAYQGSLSKKPLQIEELPTGERIVKRVEAAFKTRNLNNGHLNHYSPAGALLRNKGDHEISAEELASAELLIRAINKLLEQ